MTFTLSRKLGQTIRVIDRNTNEEILHIDVVETKEHGVRLGLDASQQYLIVRGEQNAEEKERSSPPLHSKMTGFFNDWQD